MKRDRMIHFRGTAADEARVTELAQRTGLSVSDLLRELVRSAELDQREHLNRKLRFGMFYSFKYQ